MWNLDELNKKVNDVGNNFTKNKKKILDNLMNVIVGFRLEYFSLKEVDENHPKLKNLEDKIVSLSCSFGIVLNHIEV